MRIVGTTAAAMQRNPNRGKRHLQACENRPTKMGRAPVLRYFADSVQDHAYRAARTIR